MNPKVNPSTTCILSRASSFLCAGLAVAAMAVSFGNATTVASAMNASDLDAKSCLVMDAAIFGSSAGQASIKSAPTTWSSRSTVRFNARWADDARYVV